jgi:serine/threonine-protein kinase RIO1
VTPGDSRVAFKCDLAAPPGARVITEEPRTRVWVQDVPEGGRAVVKVYRHRKKADVLLRPPLTYRVQREFNALARLQACGVPCSEPLLWAYGKSPEHGRYETLATREVPDAIDLRELILSGADPARDIDLRPLFQVVRKMHAAGVFHGALCARNVLFADGGYHIIDMPRSLVFRSSIEGSLAAMTDMLSLCHFICYASGGTPERVPVDAYGWDERQRAGFLDRCSRYRRSHGQRHGVRLRILAGHSWSRLRRTAGPQTAGAA